MKIKQIKKEIEKKFEPIVLELTIETELELKTLWNILNISNNELRERSKTNGTYLLEKNSDCYNFWKTMDNILKELKNENKNY